METILVSGATGTVGAEVVRALARAGHAPRAGVRAPATAAGLPEGVARVRLDFDDPSSLAPAFEGVSSFFFVSPLVEHQVDQARSVVAAAERAGVRHVVRLSSRATGWDQVCPLRGWHRTIEAMLDDSRLSVTHLRPCSFFQNLLAAPWLAVQARDVLPLPLGRGRIPFVDAQDLGEAAARALTDPASHAGQTYVLTNDHTYDGAALAAGMSRALGRTIRYEPVAPEAAREAGRARGMPDWLVESGLRVYGRADDGDEATTDPALSVLIGRRPTTLDAFLARVVPGREAAV